eukprot:4030_1
MSPTNSTRNPTYVPTSNPNNHSIDGLHYPSSAPTILPTINANSSHGRSENVLIIIMTIIISLLLCVVLYMTFRYRKHRNIDHGEIGYGLLQEMREDNNNEQMLSMQNVQHEGGNRVNRENNIINQNYNPPKILGNVKGVNVVDTDSDIYAL